MSKVYVVHGGQKNGYDGEDGIVIGVFALKADAIKAKEDLKDDNTWYWIEIEEWEVK